MLFSACSASCKIIWNKQQNLIFSITYSGSRVHPQQTSVLFFILPAPDTILCQCDMIVCGCTLVGCLAAIAKQKNELFEVLDADYSFLTVSRLSHCYLPPYLCFFNQLVIIPDCFFPSFICQLFFFIPADNLQMLLSAFNIWILLCQHVKFRLPFSANKSSGRPQTSLIAQAPSVFHKPVQKDRRLLRPRTNKKYWC